MWASADAPVTGCQDVWAEPNLFKLDKNAGAPGDPEQVRHVAARPVLEEEVQ